MLTFLWFVTAGRSNADLFTNPGFNFIAGNGVRRATGGMRKKKSIGSPAKGHPETPEGSTFKELFCRRYRVHESEFVINCYRRTLHREAWLVWPYLVFFRRREIQAGLQLIERLGRCHNVYEVLQCLRSFQLHEINLSFVRRKLRLRVSLRRIRREAIRLYGSPGEVVPDRIE